MYVDGRLIGSAGDFANEKNRYPIVDGHHVLKIEFPGYQSFETQMEVVANRTLNLTVELEKADPCPPDPDVVGKSGRRLRQRIRKVGKVM